MVKHLDKELGDDPDDIPDLDDYEPKSLRTQTEQDEGIEDDMEVDDSERASPDQIRMEEIRNMESRDAQKRRVGVLNLSSKEGYASLVDYMYDTDKERWCELTL